MESEKRKGYILPSTKESIDLRYNGKNYTVNSNILKKKSKIFREKSFKNGDSLDILDQNEADEIVLDDKAIEILISYLNTEENFYIPEMNDDIATSLSILAKKYQIEELCELTVQYFNENNDNLLLSNLQNPYISNSEKEMAQGILAKKLLDHIHNPKIFNTPITTLYNVVNEYLLKYNNPERKQDFFEFLFSCLDNYKTNASILFSYVDFGDASEEIIDRLLSQYKDIFDFNFINTNFLKTINQKQKEILAQIEINKQTVRNTKTQLEQLKDETNQKVQNCEDNINSTILPLCQDFNTLKNDLSLQIQNTEKKLFDERKKRKHLESILYNIESSYYFQNDSIEVFNSLIGISQKFIISGIIKRRQNDCIYKVNNLISFISNEIERLNWEKEMSNYIYIIAPKMDESLTKLNEIEVIGIGSDVTEMLFENGILNSSEFIDQINNISILVLLKF